jgi:hypothetical protein
MMTPQQRIVQKMIDNIVENHPVEKPVSHAPAPQATTTHAPAPAATEDYGLLSRKIEYGFNNLRQENADLRKQIDEIAGILKILRNDIDGVRMAVQQRKQLSANEQAPVNISPTAMPTHGGAPQYKKTEADEHFERQTGQPAHHDEAPQARGFAKKEPDMGVDIGKVFYYGKK